MGRRRIEIKKIDNQQSRYVTFSKRRTGLFKKASEFSQISKLDVALVVFSPAGNVFECGNTRAVLDHFLAPNQLQLQSSSPPSSSTNSTCTDTLFLICSEMERFLNVDLSELSEGELEERLRNLDAVEAELLRRFQEEDEARIQVVEEGQINSLSSPDDDDCDDDDEDDATMITSNCCDVDQNWNDGENKIGLEDLMCLNNLDEDNGWMDNYYSSANSEL